MRMDRRAADGPIISGLSERGFRVDAGIYRALLLTPERAEPWQPPALEVLDEPSLAPLLGLAPPPEFLLVGTGARLVRPPAALVRAIEARDIGVEVMDSRAAARAWGLLRAEGRWIGAALYPLA